MPFFFSARHNGRAPLVSLTGCVVVLAKCLTLAPFAAAADALSLAEAQRLEAGMWHLRRWSVPAWLAGISQSWARR